MKRSSIWKWLLATLVTSSLVATLAFAQSSTSQTKGVPRYNPSTESTVAGIVDDVKQVNGSTGWSGTHLTLKTDAGSLDVHVGPSAFLAKQEFTFAKGDQIEVTGSKVEYDGADALIARKIKKGDKVLILRNAQGIPVWSRRKR